MDSLWGFYLCSMAHKPMNTKGMAHTLYSHQESETNVSKIS